MMGMLMVALGVMLLINASGAANQISSEAGVNNSSSGEV